MEAALEQHLQSLAAATPALDRAPDADQREETISLGRWLLGELDRERPIVRILEQDGDRLPQLRDRFRDALVEPGYQVTADLARRLLGRAAHRIDIEALAAVLLGSLVNYRRSTWTFGAIPAGVDEERFLNTWADLAALANKPRPRVRQRSA